MYGESNNPQNEISTQFARNNPSLQSGSPSHLQHHQWQPRRRRLQYLGIQTPALLRRVRMSGELWFLQLFGDIIICCTTVLNRALSTCICTFSQGEHQCGVDREILWMEEILHHIALLKHQKYWDMSHISTGAGLNKEIKLLAIVSFSWPAHVTWQLIVHHICLPFPNGNASEKKIPGSYPNLSVQMG